MLKFVFQFASNFTKVPVSSTNLFDRSIKYWKEVGSVPRLLNLCFKTGAQVEFEQKNRPFVTITTRAFHSSRAQDKLPL